MNTKFNNLEQVHRKATSELTAKMEISSKTEEVHHNELIHALTQVEELKNKFTVSNKRMGDFMTGQNSKLNAMEC